MPQSLTVNDRAYAWPARPCAVMCVDGFDMAYIDAAIEAGRAPQLAALREAGQVQGAKGAMPSFTNPNPLVPTATKYSILSGLAWKISMPLDNGGRRMVSV